MTRGRYHYLDNRSRCGPVYTAYSRSHQRWFTIGHVCHTCWHFWPTATDP
jgi:hypothetical protein